MLRIRLRGDLPGVLAPGRQRARKADSPDFAEGWEDEVGQSQLLGPEVTQW